MSLLSLHQISYCHLSGVPVFANVTFAIDPGDRIALVGPNGCGKSTLLRVMAGEFEPVTGSMTRRRGMRAAYLAQVLTREAGDRPRSGGERVREAIEACRRADADLLLLDEPTNHLDSEAREHLERFLVAQRAAFIVVSHDREFLNRVTKRTIEMSRGKVREFAGNYDEYRRQRALIERQEWAGYDAQQSRIAAAERAAEHRDRVAAKTAKAPPGARHSHDFYRAKAARVARTGRLLRERVVHEGELAKPWEEQSISKLDFSRVPVSGEIVFRAQGLTKTADRGRSLFADLSFTVRRGERWILRGQNGSGKTTLLRVLLGEAAPEGAGSVEFGSRVRIGYYAQEAENLDPSRTAVEIARESGADESAARTMLACLRMPADKVARPVATLSAGERSKVALTRLLLSEVNLLLLDEPANHLEMEAIEALENALQQFPGAIVLVSHDRRLADALGGEVLNLST